MPDLTFHAFTFSVFTFHVFTFYETKSPCLLRQGDCSPYFVHNVPAPFLAKVVGTAGRQVSWLIWKQLPESQLRDSAGLSPDFPFSAWPFGPGHLYRSLFNFSGHSILQIGFLGKGPKHANLRVGALDRKASEKPRKARSPFAPFASFRVIRGPNPPRLRGLAEAPNCDPVCRRQPSQTHWL